MNSKISFVKKKKPLEDVSILILFTRPFNPLNIWWAIPKSHSEPISYSRLKKKQKNLLYFCALFKKKKMNQINPCTRCRESGRVDAENWTINSTLLKYTPPPLLFYVKSLKDGHVWHQLNPLSNVLFTRQRIKRPKKIQEKTNENNSSRQARERLSLTNRA